MYITGNRVRISDDVRDSKDWKFLEKYKEQELTVSRSVGECKGLTTHYAVLDKDMQLIMSEKNPHVMFPFIDADLERIHILSKRSVSDFMEKMVTFRGDMEEIDTKLSAFFGVEIRIDKSSADVVLDKSYIFSFKNDDFLADIDVFYIEDSVGDSYITEVSCHFE